MTGPSLVAGIYMDRSLVDFQAACEVHLAEEQRKPHPDNALIAVLGDAVRCARELALASAIAVDVLPQPEVRALASAIAVGLLPEAEGRAVRRRPPVATAVASPACLDCGRPYADFPLDVILPRPQWLLIHPDDGGLLCAHCLVARAAGVPGAMAVHAVIEIAPSMLAIRAARDAEWEPLS